MISREIEVSFEIRESEIKDNSSSRESLTFLIASVCSTRWVSYVVIKGNSLIAVLTLWLAFLHIHTVLQIHILYEDLKYVITYLFIHRHLISLWYKTYLDGRRWSKNSTLMCQIWGFFSPRLDNPSEHRSHCSGFEITLRHSTLDRTTLDEWSARRRGLY